MDPTTILAIILGALLGVILTRRGPPGPMGPLGHPGRDGDHGVCHWQPA